MAGASSGFPVAASVCVCVFLVCTYVCHPPVLPHHQQGAGLEGEQPEHELASIWDAGVRGHFSCYATMLGSALSFFFLNINLELVYLLGAYWVVQQW